MKPKNLALAKFVEEQYKPKPTSVPKKESSLNEMQLQQQQLLKKASK